MRISDWSSDVCSSDLIIGLEMATVYRALGSQVTVVEFMDQLMPGADADLVKPLAARLKKQGVAVHLKTKVVEAKAQKRSEEHTSVLQSLMRSSYAVCCLKKNKRYKKDDIYHEQPVAAIPLLYLCCTSDPSAIV